MSYIDKKFTFHEIDTSKLDDTTIKELAKHNVKLQISGNNTYVVNPSKPILELLAKRKLLKGVAVIYDLDENTYKVIPKPAAILCSLAGTCQILKEFSNSSQAYKYLEKLRR